jgi:UDP-N-acetylglucosamine 1-carboxyvinyltransferase
MAHGIGGGMRIGQRVRELRERAGLTQTQLARAVDTSDSAISALERGKHEPKIGFLLRVGVALGVKTSELVDGIEVPR